MIRWYGHWRSLATYRVRVALNIKGIASEFVPVDLLGKEHLGEQYRKINPQGLLPAFFDGGKPVLFQSMAIVEYLDEMYPQPPLLPHGDAHARSRLRGLALIIAADAHPLIVPRVRDYLQFKLGLDDAARLDWIKAFGMPALDAVESHLGTDENVGTFCYGNTPTIADIFLASHVIGMSLFGCSLERHPRVAAIYDACSALEEFATAHPLKQPGAEAFNVKK